MTKEQEKEQFVRDAFASLGILPRQMDRAFRIWKQLCEKHPEDYSFTTVLRKYRKIPS